MSLEAVTDNYVEFLEWMGTKKSISTGSFMLIRSALSSLFRLVYETEEFGKRYRAQLLARRKRNEQPRQPKRRDVFPLTLLLSFYRQMQPNVQLSDSDLRAKVATMLVLYIMLRPIDMTRMDFSRVSEISGGLMFTAVLKNIPEYSECVLARVDEKQLCPVDAVLELWARVRVAKPDATGLFFDDLFTAPLTKYKLEREMKALMLRAGIDIRYTPYSIKHAAITHLLSVGVDEVIINKNARLSRFAGTAVKHYFVGKAGVICAKAIATTVPEAVSVSSSVRTMESEIQERMRDRKEKQEGEHEREEMQVDGDVHEDIVSEGDDGVGNDEGEEEDTQGERKKVDEFIRKGEEEMENEEDQFEPKGYPGQQWARSVFDFPLDVDLSMLTEGFQLEDHIWEGIQIIPHTLFNDPSDDYPRFLSVCDALCKSGTQRRRRPLAPDRPGGV
jgi:integrase